MLLIGRYSDKIRDSKGDYMQLVQDIYKIIEYSQKMTSKNLKSHLFNLEFDRKKIV